LPLPTTVFLSFSRQHSLFRSNQRLSRPFFFPRTAEKTVQHQYHFNQSQYITQKTDIMKYTAATLALVAGATAHTVMSEIYIDGEGMGSGTCVRAPKNPVGAVDPVIDLGSSDMACGKDGTKGVARTCPITGGHQISFEYRQWPEDYSRGPLDMGHMGPCAVYLKKVEDATTDTAEGDGWFKLWDEGYDESSGKWCTQKMIGNAGRISVTIPDSLAGGDYLVRPELLALHNIAVKDQPEYYVGCAQVFLESSGSSGPEKTVSIPGYTSKSDPGNQYNAFDKPLKPFTIPGPEVYKSTASYSRMASQKQTNGLAPAGCILTNDNWCGKEIPDFTDEEGCWVADKDCWAQLDECYDDASSAGSANCKIWEQKCKDNQGICKSGGSGPYNKGQSIQPKADMIETPASSNGNMDYGSSGSSSNSGSDSKPQEAASSSAAPSSSAAATSSYKKKEVQAPASQAPAYSQANNDDSYSAPQQTSVAEYKPARSSHNAQPTTMVTKAAAQDNNDNVEVVYQTVYETVNAYTTVTDQAYATAAPAHYRRHAHRRHAIN
jgi:hypothetical protein